MRVALFGPVRDVVNQDGLTLEVAEDAEVSALLGLLIAEHGDGFRRSLLREDGAIWPTMAILVNGANILLGRGLATTLHEGDEVAIVPVISGGGQAADRQKH